MSRQLFVQSLRWHLVLCHQMHLLDFFFLFTTMRSVADDAVRDTWTSTFRFNESNHRRNTVVTIWTFLHVLYTKVCQGRV
jgi:hypothetical protein